MTTKTIIRRNKLARRRNMQIYRKAKHRGIISRNLVGKNVNARFDAQLYVLLSEGKTL